MKMKNRKTTAALLLAAMACLSIFGLARAGSEENMTDTYEIGVSFRTLGNLNPNDAAAALKAWAAALPKEHGFDWRIDIELNAYDTKELIASYKRNELDGFWITVEEMLEIGIAPLAVFMGDRGSDGPEVSYAVVAHRQGSVRSIDDLVNCRLAMTSGSEYMILAMPWLETVLMETAAGKNSRKFESLVPVEKPSKAIFQVFFHQVDAAVVTKASFELACELNPQLRKDLVVLTESPGFITSVFMFRPSLYQDPKMPRVEKILLDIHKTVGGKQLLNIIKSDRMRKNSPAVLDGTIRFLKEYKRLMTDSLFVEVQP